MSFTTGITVLVQKISTSNNIMFVFNFLFFVQFTYVNDNYKVTTSRQDIKGISDLQVIDSCEIDKKTYAHKSLSSVKSIHCIIIYLKQDLFKTLRIYRLTVKLK